MATHKPKFRLLLDFDGTITTNDTTGIIGSRCLNQARQWVEPHVPETQLPKPMSFYTDKYMDDYRAWKTSQTQNPEDCQSVNEIIGHLSSSRNVEQNSFIRVRDALLSFPGKMQELEQNEPLRNEFMIQAGRQTVRNGEVGLRDQQSLRQLLRHAEAVSGKQSWRIISVSWSRMFILGTLLEGRMVSDGEEDFSDRIQSNEILAPLQYDDHGRPLTICTARDKLDAMKAFTSGTDAFDDEDTIVVYVGDSSTDVGCLAEATIGFHLSSSLEENAAVRAVQRCGVEKRSIHDLMASESIVNQLIEERKNDKKRRIICEVQGFGEILGWVEKYFQALDHQ